MGWQLLPVTHPATTRPFDLAGMAVLGIMLASLAYGLNQIDTQNFFGSLAWLSVWPSFVIGIILLFVFPAIEKKAAAQFLI